MDTTTINPQIFMSDDILSLLGKKLYNGSTQSILVRELIQNSVDAHSSKIDFTIQNNRDDKNFGDYITDITCKDNGIGMSQDTLLNTFLGIGKSKKFGSNNTGGFGIAKVSLFAALDWQLETNQENSTIMRIEKNEGNLTYQESRNRKLSGTLIHACYKNYMHDSNYEPFLLIGSNVKSKIRVNGKLIKPTKNLKTIDFKYYGDYLYTVSKSKPHDIYGDGLSKYGGYIVYRINGLPQFISHIWDNEDILIFVDFDNIGYLPRDDKYPFSLSRESIEYSISYEINQIVNVLTSDKLSRNRNLESGSKKAKQKIVRDLAYELKRGDRVCQNDKKIARLYKSIIDVINGKLKLEIHKYISGITTDSEINGARQNDLNGFVVYWINPKNLDLRNKSKDEIIFQLFLLATHEITHVDYSTHNEDFTCGMGDNQRSSIGILLENLPKLRRQVTMIWDEDNTI